MPTQDPPAIRRATSSTSSLRKRRCPPSVTRQGIRPCVAHRLMVFGDTWSTRATSPGVRYSLPSTSFIHLPRYASQRSMATDYRRKDQLAKAPETVILREGRRHEGIRTESSSGRTTASMAPVAGDPRSGRRRRMEGGDAGGMGRGARGRRARPRRARRGQARRCWRRFRTYAPWAFTAGSATRCAVSGPSGSILTGGGERRSAHDADLAAKCPYEGLVALRRRRYAAEVWFVMVSRPPVERIRALPAPDDGGQAASAAMNDIPVLGEPERSGLQPRGLGGRKQVVRGVTTRCKRSDRRSPYPGRIEEKRVQPKLLALVPPIPFRFADERRVMILRGRERMAQSIGTSDDAVGVEHPDPVGTALWSASQPGQCLVERWAVEQVDLVGEKHAQPCILDLGEQLCGPSPEPFSTTRTSSERQSRTR